MATLSPVCSTKSYYRVHQLFACLLALQLADETTARPKTVAMQYMVLFSQRMVREPSVPLSQ